MNELNATVLKKDTINILIFLFPPGSPESLRVGGKDYGVDGRGDWEDINKICKFRQFCWEMGQVGTEGLENGMLKDEGSWAWRLMPLMPALKIQRQG